MHLLMDPMGCARCEGEVDEHCADFGSSVIKRHGILHGSGAGAFVRTASLRLKDGDASGWR